MYVETILVGVIPTKFQCFNERKKMFIKYQHIEKFGTDETEGIEHGKTYVFPKIDGTNASLWLEKGEIQAGSRRRHLNIGDDNAGFHAWVKLQDNFKEFFKEYPHLRLFGEWLVPHSLKTYRQEAWRIFYVFDVCRVVYDDSLKYICYDDYKTYLEKYDIEYIPPIRIINNGNYETYIKLLEQNNYLIEDGKGSGEGVVIKNYNYENKYGRTTWAKIVTSEFKEKAHKEMGAPEVDGKIMVEDRIISEYCTEALIKKTFEKIKLDGWNSKKIPQLLGVVYHDLVTEEIWDIIKKLKKPTINFKTLQYKVNIKIKEVLIWASPPCITEMKGAGGTNLRKSPLAVVLRPCYFAARLKLRRKEHVVKACSAHISAFFNWRLFGRRPDTNEYFHSAYFHYNNS